MSDDQIPALEPLPGTGAKRESSTEKKRNQKDGTFCGFSKGFFDKSHSTRNKKSSQDDLIEVKPSRCPENNLVFKEVQDAMRPESIVPDPKEWLTDELLEEIQKDPQLEMLLSHPHFSQILMEFIKNPEKAAKEHANNELISDAFRKMANILGHHFTRLGEEDNEELMDLDVRRALLDPQIRALVTAVKQGSHINPRKLLATAPPKLKKHLEVLLQKGYLAST